MASTFFLLGGEGGLLTCLLLWFYCRGSSKQSVWLKEDWLTGEDRIVRFGGTLERGRWGRGEG